MERIFEVKGELITSGLHPGKGNSQVPLWKDGSNVVFKDSSVKPGPFQSLLFNKPSGLLGLGVRAIDNDGSPAAVWGNRKALYRGIEIPTVNDATRLNDIILSMDTDAINWKSALTNRFNETVVVAPDSTRSLRLEPDTAGVGYGEGYYGEYGYGGVGGPVSYMRVWRNLAGITSFKDRVFQFWARANTQAHGKLAVADGIKVRLSSSTAAASDYFDYDLPSSGIPLANTWSQLTLDLDTATPSGSSGSPNLASIRSIMITFQFTSSAAAGDIAYLDELGFSGAYTGTDLDRWSIVQFGQSVLATNGVDEIQYLADINTGNFMNLSAAGGNLPQTFRCKILQKLGPFVIAFNTDNDNTEVIWCSEDNVLDWLPVASNSARDINLRDMNSDIKAVVEFGNSLLVVGNSRAHIFQFIGAPLFFGAQKLIDGIGAVSSNAVTEGGRLIYGFAETGIWVTDGSTKQYIDEPDVHSFIYEGDNKYDRDRAALVCGWEDSNDDEIYFSYPTVNGLGFTVSFNPALRVWSMHDYWRTAAGPGEPWNAPLLLADTGDLFLQSIEGAGSTFDVNPLGLSDSTRILLGYGEGGYGQLAYGGDTTIG